MVSMSFQSLFFLVFVKKKQNKAKPHQNPKVIFTLMMKYMVALNSGYCKPCPYLFQTFDPVFCVVGVVK